MQSLFCPSLINGYCILSLSNSEYAFTFLRDVTLLEPIVGGRSRLRKRSPPDTRALRGLHLLKNSGAAALLFFACATAPVLYYSNTPESVKPDCFKVFEIRMKSSTSDILSNMIFCTHLVQIQAPKFLLKNQCLSVFQRYFEI